MESQVRAPVSARTACFSCRRGKRRCDKSLPSCQLCVKKEIDCTYLSRRANYITAVLSPLVSITQSSVSDTSKDYAAISFLAQHLVLEVPLELPHIDVPIPDSIRESIGGTSNIRDISVSFFECIHSWMPIISKRRFYTLLLNPLSRRQTELSLLAICMKLYCTSPPEGSDGRIELYRRAKQFHFEVETAGLMSIHVLQAGVVISLYEISQAIYPAAHLSVSGCARYGAALGIDKLGLELIGAENRMRPWIEIEEMRRVWWSVLLLDRYMNISQPSRRLATENPTINFYLPVDTQSWDDGKSTPEDAVIISTGFTLEMGLFSRLAQATYLLSEVLNSSASSKTDESNSLNKIVQLRRTLFALLHVADNEARVRKIEFCAQTAVCFSAMLLLDGLHWQQEYSQTSDTESNSSSLVSEESTLALVALSRLACPFFTECLDDPAIMNSVPIFLIHVTYQAASILTRIGQGSPNTAARENITHIKHHLEILSGRWRVAGVYRAILEAEEVMADMKMP